MSFLSPWFLAGLLALALPLWLHRLERTSAERRPWSSLAFFRAGPEESLRRRRYRYLALLACRLGLLALLALFFARPMSGSGLALAPARSIRHVVAVDTSHSMAHGDTWAQAAAAAASILTGLGGADRSQLLSFGPGVNVHGGVTGDHGSWITTLRGLAPTGGRGGYGELAEAVRTIAAEEPGPLHLHLVSDLQHTAAPERFADLALPAGAVLLRHDVGPPMRPNWTVESVRGDRQLYGDVPVTLEATIAGFETPAAVRRVELHVGGRLTRTAEAALPASGRTVVRFADVAVPRGYSRVEIRLSPRDRLAADDVFHVSLHRTDAVPVLFVRADADARAEVYYRAALQAAAGGVFELQAATPEATQTLSLDRFRFVVVHDIGRPPALLESRLRAFAEGGRAIFVIAGAQAAREKAAPWTLGALADSGRHERPLHASPAAAGAVLFTLSDDVGDVRFHRHLRAAEVRADHVLARLADGAALLYQQPLGAGRLLVLTSPLDTRWNDWPRHPSFVTFVEASARWLAGLDAGPSSAAVGDVLDVARLAQAGVGVEVLDPQGRRVLGLASGGRVTLSRAGVYEIRRPGLVTEKAVNIDARESDLRRLDDATIERWQSTAETPRGDAAASAPSPPRDLSRAMLWALLAVVLVESTLANRYLRPGPPSVD